MNDLDLLYIKLSDAINHQPSVDLSVGDKYPVYELTLSNGSLIGNWTRVPKRGEPVFLRMKYGLVFSLSATIASTIIKPEESRPTTFRFLPVKKEGTNIVYELPLSKFILRDLGRGQQTLQFTIKSEYSSTYASTFEENVYLTNIYPEYYSKSCNETDLDSAYKVLNALNLTTKTDCKELKPTFIYPFSYSNNNYLCFGNATIQYLIDSLSSYKLLVNNSRLSAIEAFGYTVDDIKNIILYYCNPGESKPTRADDTLHSGAYLDDDNYLEGMKHKQHMRKSSDGFYAMINTKNIYSTSEDNEFVYGMKITMNDGVTINTASYSDYPNKFIFTDSVDEDKEDIKEAFKWLD